MVVIAVQCSDAQDLEENVKTNELNGRVESAGLDSLHLHASCEMWPSRVEQPASLQMNRSDKESEFGVL